MSIADDKEQNARLIKLELNQEQFKADNYEIKQDLKTVVSDIQEMKRQMARWGGMGAVLAVLGTGFGVIIANIKHILGIGVVQ